MSDAFLANQVRGVDSSGMFQVVGNKMSVLKKAFNASLFLAQSDTKKMISEVPRANVTVGHVRAATEGKITPENAHPFVAFKESGSKIVGVHNGTLRNWRGHDSAKNINVDSEWAFEMIAEHGEDAFQYFDGAFAFVWWDEDEPDYLFVARNDARPLHFLVTSSDKSLLAASEAGMLAWLAERNQFRMSNTKDMDKIFSFMSGNIYKMSLKNPGRYTYNAFPALDRRLLPSASSVTTYPATQGSYYGDDGIPWGTPGQSYRSAYYDYDRAYGQSGILTAVKKALDEARARRLAPPKKDEEALVINAEELDRQLEEAIVKEISDFQEKKAATKATDFSTLLSTNKHFIHTPQLSNASHDEIKLAKEKEVFGRVLLLHGVYYDSETSRGFGSVYTLGDDGKMKSGDAEIRFLSEATFMSRYCDVKDDGDRRGTMVAVVGINNKGMVAINGQGWTPTLVLAPMDAIQQEMIYKTVMNTQAKRVAAH